MKRKLPIIIIVATLLVALGGGALLMRSSESSTPQSNSPQSPRSASTNAANPRPVAAGKDGVAHSRGRADAPVLLEEYGDFQCPPCGLFHPVLKRIEHEYETRVRVVFHQFPLRTLHKHAAEAARAAEAAGLQGKFWEMHDLLFEKQAEWKDAESVRPIFLNYARTLGLNLERFNTDIDSTIVSNRVMSAEHEGVARGVTGTPTVFLNGRELTFEESTNYTQLRGLIERELAAKK